MPHLFFGAPKTGIMVWILIVLLNLLLFSTKKLRAYLFRWSFPPYTPLTSWVDISGTDPAMDSFISLHFHFI